MPPDIAIGHLPHVDSMKDEVNCSMSGRMWSIGGGVAALIGGALLVLGSQVSIAAPARAPAEQAAPTPTPFSLDDLSLIQPGLGTVMVEYSHRMAIVWFAGEASNWNLAHYQIIEMREIQETGEITRPPRAPALKSFESSFLDPLDAAIMANDKTQFESAYRAAIQGCNSCHGSQTSADFPQGFGFIHVQVPQDMSYESIWSYAP
jgi:hypothetical protein